MDSMIGATRSYIKLVTKWGLKQSTPKPTFSVQEDQLNPTGLKMEEAEPDNVNEFQILAKKILPKMYYDYYAGGAEDQYTLHQNVEAFQKILLRPRVLVDVSRISMATSILGYKISAPILIAPTAMHKLANPEGELATARAAAACNTIMVLSFSSSYSLEDVAASCNAIRFFQLYVYKNREIAAKMVQRAEKNGYKAIVLTADSPRHGRREADMKNKLILPPRDNLKGLLSSETANLQKNSRNDVFVNQAFDPSLSWKDIEWLKSYTNLPILIKGILNPDDAIKAIEVGVAGIIVSNHGGRQLNYNRPSISALEEVVDAVKGKIPVLFDGGVRRGTSIFKALALGAKAVLIGRPIVFGLTVKGENGVKQVFEMLKNELELTMAFSGCPSLKDITRNHVRTEHDRLRIQALL